MLVRNLKPYGSRCVPIAKAVWSSNSELLALADDYRDGREWARRVVRTSTPGKNHVATVTLAELVAGLGGRRVSILKMDIEGAESEVFRDTTDSWLRFVDCIVVELHDRDDESQFHAVVNDREWVKNRYGELTVALRSQG
jgi:FkbM family methyltransferase